VEGKQFIMADQEFHTSNQDDESQTIATLLQQYQSIAAQLVNNKTPEEANTALEPIQSQDETIQIAFLKELAKEKTLDAANITQAIHILSPSKAVRKEARRRLIQLESSNIYATWTPPPIVPTFTQALESITGESLPTETEALLSELEELEELFRERTQMSEAPGFQLAIEDFLESWGDENFLDVYSLLAQESTIKEDISYDDWLEKREDWVRKAAPNDIQIMFIHANNDEQDEDSQQPVFVDVGLSLELTDPQPLVEWPAATLSFPETGRHWYWLRYTMVQEDENWVIQAISSEASAIMTLPEEELFQRIEANRTELEQLSQRIAENEIDEEDDSNSEKFIDEDGNIDIVFDPSGPSDMAKVIDTTAVKAGENIPIFDAEVVDEDLLDEEDEEDEDSDFDEVADLLDGSLDDMDTMLRLVTQSLHYYDAIFAKDPAKYSDYYKDAFNLSRTLHDLERAIIYAKQATIYAPEERSIAFANLAMSYQALAFRLHEEDDHEREGQFDDLVEPALRESVAADENPANMTALATVLVLNDQDLNEAETYFIKAQKGPLTPELSVNIETGLGEIAIINEDYAKAINHFQTLSKLVPNEAQIWYRLGYLHHHLENIDEAIKALRQSIELDPELTEAYTELGGIYTTQGNIRLAREIVQQGLDENPEAADLYATMALIYINSNDLASANRQLTKAEAFDSEDEFVLEARRRYNAEIKQRPRTAQNKSQPKQKQHKAKKR
jgi:tetratricopeptide (TPR) repeat protein